MRQPQTLSQLGRVLDTYPSKVRHHLKQLEEARLVELSSTQIVRGFVEKYYSATAQAYLVNLAIVPQTTKKGAILAFGSHDLALEMLSQQLDKIGPSPELYTVPVGSLEGLIALRQGVCQLAGCHLLDEASGEYNRDYVRHLFPGKSMLLFNLTHRQQGLLVPPGNPQGIRELADLTREDVNFVNRQPGSGTRIWLDQKLGELGISSEHVRGYDEERNTHLQVGRAVANGDAAAGIGLLAAARSCDLDYVPLFAERFDLVLPGESKDLPEIQPLLDQLQSAKFRKAIAGLGGYETRHTGEVLSVNG
jgi:putative molybdopterin biosynthesis protein